MRNFAHSPQAGREAKGLCALLLLFLLAINGLNVVNSYVGRNFITAIEQRKNFDFLFNAALWIGVFAGSTFCAVSQRYFEERLALLWRTWTTRQVIASYMRGRSYMRLANTGEIENPDQRIAEDIKSFTIGTLSFVLMILNAAITVIAFSAVLWSISPLLFGVGLLYATIGTYITVRLGYSLIGLNFRQLDKEANFRAVLVHVRENAAALALARREDYLAARLTGRLADLTDNFRAIIGVHRRVGFFTTGYNWMIQILPALVVAPLFIKGEVAFGVVTQSAVAFGHLLAAFSLIVTQFQSISSFAAVVARVDSLFKAIDVPAVTPPVALISVESGDCVTYESVTLHSVRRQRMLIDNLQLSIRPGQRTFIRGPDNAARFALLRATAGTWTAGSGRIGRPSLSQIMFLPERPYLPPGTLHDIMLPIASFWSCAPGAHGEYEQRPDRARHDAVTDQQIVDVLHALEGDSLVTRAGGFEQEQQWETLFTLNDQQLLVCARLLLVAPRFVFLERPAATLEPPQLTRLLRLLTAREITYVVFDKEMSDLHPYDQLLDIEPNGSWQVVSPPLQTPAI